MTPHERNQKNEGDAQTTRRRLLADYRSTFRSESGARVLAAIEQSVGYGRPAFLPTADGTVCPYAAASRDGRKSVIDEIHANLADTDGTAPTGIR